MSLEILKKYKIKAKKALGQNFLINEKIIEEIANTLIVEGQNIVEVGPGYGALTEKLLNKKPKSLNLVELDRDMINILESRVEKGELNTSGIDFIINNKDVLKYEPSPLAPLPKGEGDYKYSVIANIPYYITSPILRHFLYNLDNKPENMLILMQKDVGEKIIKTSPPTPLLTGEGSNKNKIKSSVIGLMVAKKCYVSDILFVGKENFIPVPKVESSVILFETHGLYNDIDDDKFLKIIKIGFSAVRKKLVKNFIIGGYEKCYIIDLLKGLGISENIRGEDLSIGEWCELVKKIKVI